MLIERYLLNKILIDDYVTQAKVLFLHFKYFNVFDSNTKQTIAKKKNAAFET